MWELDYEEIWALKNWCFWTEVLEKILEGPLDCKKIQPNPKGNQSWMFIRSTDAEAETPILWPPDVKNWLLRRDPNDWKDWGMNRSRWQRMRWLDGWLGYWLDRHEFEQAPRVGDGQGSLACCSPWGHKELDMTEKLHWIEVNLPMGVWV